MEYSSDDIAAARSLQFSTYIHVSMATFWSYDYVCSLHEEWMFLFRSNWSKLKGLYIVTRYLPFMFLATLLYVNFIPNENLDTCWVLSVINSGFGMVLVIFSECLFILRTYVLWNNNKILLVAMLSTAFTFIAASSSIIFTTTIPAAYSTSAIPGITGCYLSSTSFQLFIPFLLFFVFGLGLMMLALIRAIQNWQINSGHLYVVLLSHNIFYYACGLLFAVINIFASLLLQYSYNSMLHDFQFVILAILATRMHLHLWQMNQHAHGPGALVRTTMSDMSSIIFMA
ncbi:hypothetical protein BDR07DRAFT_363062 [Suillus spraguei]|nr:hypothetical protein BDR07DRAFT_363062 [Suillus spraguei]